MCASSVELFVCMGKSGDVCSMNSPIKFKDWPHKCTRFENFQLADGPKFPMEAELLDFVFDNDGPVDQIGASFEKELCKEKSVEITQTSDWSISSSLSASIDVFAGALSTTLEV